MRCFPGLTQVTTHSILWLKVNLGSTSHGPKANPNETSAAKLNKSLSKGFLLHCLLTLMAFTIHIQKSHRKPAQRRPPWKRMPGAQTAGGAEPRAPETINTQAEAERGAGRAARRISPTCGLGPAGTGGNAPSRSPAPAAGDGEAALITAAPVAQPARRRSPGTAARCRPSRRLRRGRPGPALSRHSLRLLGWARFGSARLGFAAALTAWPPTAST